MNYNELKQQLEAEAELPMPTGPSGLPMPEHMPVLAEDGSFAPEWYNRFEDLQPAARTLAKFKRPEALAKSYAALESLKGYPDPQDAAHMAAFRRSVGLPEKAEEFAIARPEDTPDDAWDDALAERLSQVAYEYGIPAPAMQALAGSYAKECRSQLEMWRAAQEKAVEEAEAELQSEWGTQYESNLQAAQNALLRLSSECGVDGDALMDNPALRTSPDFIRVLNEAAKLMEEAPMRRGGSSDNPKEEARRMLYDPSHPLHEAYMKTNHPQHKYANELYDRLAFGK